VSSRSRAVLPTLLASSLLLTSLLAGCGGDAGTVAASSAALTPEVSSETARTDAASEGDTAEDGSPGAPSFSGDTEADVADASGDARVTVRDIRVGRHDGFDRVVLEVGGEGRPGWDVRYVDEASSQGSGDPVEVAGDAVLQLTVTGAGYPYDTGVEEFPIADTVSASDTVAVTEVAFDGTFEGTSVAFVGLQARAPFRVYLLEGPTRLVLEVAHAG
jgi:hypothetical protein